MCNWSLRLLASEAISGVLLGWGMMGWGGVVIILSYLVLHILDALWPTAHRYVLLSNYK